MANNIINIESHISFKKTQKSYLNNNNKMRYKEISCFNLIDFCLHELCPICSGTGIRIDTKEFCFHHLVCICKKCSAFK